MAKSKTVQLENARKGQYIINEKIDRPDAEIMAKTHAVMGGKRAFFNRDNPSVQVAARGGALTPVDAEGRAWVLSLKAPEGRLL